MSAHESLVEEWTRHVRSTLVDAATERAARPSMTLSITPGFLVLATLIGAPHGVAGSLATLAILASVLLVHEVSRGALALALRRSSRIVISAAGGRTDIPGEPPRGLETVGLTVVGPVANGLAALAALAGCHLLGSAGAALLRGLAFAHVVWAGAQLLPIVPFRMGMTLSLSLSPSVRFAHAAASLAVLATAFVLVWSLGAPLLLAIVLLSVMATAQVVNDARKRSSDAQPSGPDTLAAAAEARLSEGQPEEAAELARSGLALALSAGTRERLWKALAWASIAEQDPFGAHAALLQMPAQTVDLHLLTAYLACCGRTGEAIGLLEEARSLGCRTPETTKLLADLLFRRGDRQAVRSLAESDLEPLSKEDRRAIEAALLGA